MDWELPRACQYCPFYLLEEGDKCEKCYRMYQPKKCAKCSLTFVPGEILDYKVEKEEEMKCFRMECLQA
jgi:hypothetical protein